MREMHFCKKQDPLLHFFLFPFGLRLHRFWNGRFKRVMVGNINITWVCSTGILITWTKQENCFSNVVHEPDFAAFYAGRANLIDETKGEQKIADLQHAIQMDKDQWRYHKLLTETYINQEKYDQALLVVEPFYRSHPNDYIMGMLYAKTLLLNKKFKESDAVLTKLNIIPFEGATEGRELYREAKLMQAIAEMQKKNYNNALKFINASKLWPREFGSRQTLR